MSLSTTNETILLFDGVCNLCNGAVQFIIKRDKKAKFKFAALQSDAGQALLKEFNLPTDAFESFVLIHQNKAYQQSDAALRVAKLLGGFWELFYVFIVFPRIIRDGLYRMVANSRYKLFGRTDSCMIPTPELKARFL